jgi:hypothetical protein
MATYKNQPRDDGPDVNTTPFHDAAADLSLVGNNVKGEGIKK